MSDEIEIEERLGDCTLIATRCDDGSVIILLDTGRSEDEAQSISMDSDDARNLAAFLGEDNKTSHRLCEQCKARVELVGLLAALADGSICHACDEAMALGRVPQCVKCGETNTCTHEPWHAASTWTLSEVVDFLESAGTVEGLTALRSMFTAANGVQAMMSQRRKDGAK